ncbi:MAG TPA: NlpC/P60 family protein [Ilumatobacteraceae bacterium]|nr:NlpC/P60 family protein [Ilumatobacteraceae bacterium]
MSTSHISTDTSVRPLGRERTNFGAATRAVIVGVILTAATVAGTLAVADDSASAVSGPLATNAMAPIVTTSARQALESYDQWVVSNDAAAYRSFVWFRTQTAQYAASELGYPQAEMVEAWAATPVGHQLAVLGAMTQVGVPYRTNTSQEGVGFDCSGLTTYAWSRAGVQLTRQSGAQIREAAPLERDTAKAGDLAQYPGHVMMYLGVGDAVIHSVMSGRTVELDTINTRRTNSVRFGDPTL